MPISEAQKRATDKYIRSTFDELKIRVPKGNKEIIQSYVQENEESLNGYINRLIYDDMKKNKK